MPESGRHLVVLTRERASASFRQRVEPYLSALAEAGVACEVVELGDSLLARSRQLARVGRSAVWLQRKTLTAWDAWMLGPQARVIYDFDDAVMFQARRSEDGPHPGRKRRFARTVRRSRLVLAGNEILADHAREAGAAGQVAVVPTGLDASRFAPKADRAAGGRLRLVWIGSRSTLKQVERLREVLEALPARVPGVSLRIIADAGLDVAGLAVENVAWSYEAEARLLSECDVGIAPLPETNFTRGKCGFKILQYMAAGLPVVASPVGVQSDIVREGESGFCAATTEQWLDAIAKLAADVDLRRRMGAAGRQRVEREFDFKVLRPRVCELVLGVL
ncbi:MAG: D-inositol-3-phosphate glycosyltransferase [Planctomycetes bacterium ADurb.Bin126]|nr:MAG: D-inositol-3-phosphate glycosyltransferase [Planctomycetes bacterium ADurb.Bin126]